MFEGVDEAVDMNRAERRAALARIDSEFTAKGLYRSGPRLRETANELGRRYEALADQLYDMASKQPDQLEAYFHVGDRLRQEYDQFRTELTDAVSGIDGGNDALKAVMAILDGSRTRVEGLATRFASRENSPASAQPLEGEDGNYLVTEDGNRIVTEDGDPIMLSGDARVTEEGDIRVTEDGDVRVTEDGNRRVPENVSFGDAAEAEVIPAPTRSSGWTGRLSQAERVQVIKTLAPVAQVEIRDLIERVAEQRFNDELTQDALAQLRRLHDTLGQLIEAADQGKPLDQLLAAFGQDRDKFYNLLKQGANVVIAAPALTFGMVKILAVLCGVPIDGGLVGGVYAAMLDRLCGKRKAS